MPANGSLPLNKMAAPSCHVRYWIVQRFRLLLPADREYAPDATLYGKPNTRGMDRELGTSPAGHPRKIERRVPGRNYSSLQLGRALISINTR